MLSLRTALFITVATLILGACRSDTEPSTPGASDGATGVAPQATEEPRGDRLDPSKAQNFNDLVYREYAGLALGVSRREQDSIVHSTPISQIEAVMTARMRRQDSVAREQLAAKHAITRDSVDAILAARNVPKR
jgi:hypothetical protein